LLGLGAGIVAGVVVDFAAASIIPSAGGVLAANGDGVPDDDDFEPSVYERPRHQTGSLELRSLIGSESQILWKMRRPTRLTSAPAAMATSIAVASFGEVPDTADCQVL
jgi:hypothetical protein